MHLNLCFYIRSIVCGVALFQIKKEDKRILAILLALIFVIAVNNHVHENYYEVVTEEDYDSFIWIKENLNQSYGTTILDPWKAVAYEALTQKSSYHKIPIGEMRVDSHRRNLIYEFLNNNCTDSEFLIKNEIDIVYTSGSCDNNNLTKVYNNVYVFTGPNPN